MIHPNSEYFAQHQAAIEYITSAAVGFPVGIHIGDGRDIGEMPEYYQIIPSSQAEDDRQDVSEFFDWHFTHNQQWFETPIEAAAAFVKAWRSWKRGAPR